MSATADQELAELRRAYAESLRSNAELQNERDAALADLQARTAALAQRNTEYGERIEQQSAIVDVLKVMSASPGDPQPVFDLITRRAAELCSSRGASIFEYDGELVHSRSRYHSDRPMATASALLFGAAEIAQASRFYAAFPMKPERGVLACRAILDRQVIHTRDTQAEPELLPIYRDLGIRSILAIPLLRDDNAIGAFAMNSEEPGGFADSQVALLQTFAEQAVIAITSAETYRTLQTRTSDLQETLEYQTATGEVLNVISRSTFDLKPVLARVAQTAVGLCIADQAAIFLVKAGMAHLAANFGFPPEYEDTMAERGSFPILPNSPSIGHRALTERRIVHMHDVAAVPGYPETLVRLGGQRSTLGVPILREGEAIGVIVLARQRVEPFTDRQIELVSTFADQAVMAIENTRLLTETREALEQQTATAEVLGFINSSPGHLAPVFDAMLERALRLCDAVCGTLWTFDGAAFRLVAQHDVPAEFDEFLRDAGPLLPRDRSPMRRLIDGEHFVHSEDITKNSLPSSLGMRAALAKAGARTTLYVALRKDEVLLGAIYLYRREVRPFVESQIALLQNFAAQAVIAMENARLLTETREALEQQTATAEVLQVISASPGDLTPVFDVILERALHLCEANCGNIVINDGEVFDFVAAAGHAGFDEWLRQNGPARPGPGTTMERMLRGEQVVHVIDIADDDVYRAASPVRKALVDVGGFHTFLGVALRKDDALLGILHIYRQEVRPFSEKQIALLQNFAAQAVIAMENARLLDELRQRQEELRVTFENMGDGVALFDETRHLVASNRQFQDMLDVPDDVISSRPTFADYIRYLADRGEYGPNPEEHVQHLLAFGDQPMAFERTRPNGRILEIRGNPVPGGGFVVIYSDITDRKRNEEELRAARDAAEEASRTIEAAYRDLKAAQANLIQAEKMASLGQLTAGIAHEIKNPLNFVNNFAELSGDLLDELNDAVAGNRQAEIDELKATLQGNLAKITEHGRRADGIVKAMLEHSRGSSGERRIVDLNALIDEALNLAYHGARAQDQSFNITLERDFAEGVAPIEVNPQDMTRVFLNLFSNGFYAATRRARECADAGFVPTLKVTTIDAGEAVEIHVRDNGIGISADIKDKLFQPFFTTKPTGEGTGLGLSITYDIVTQQHGGSIAVDSKVGEYSEFTIRLPRSL